MESFDGIVPVIYSFFTSSKPPRPSAQHVLALPDDSGSHLHPPLPAPDWKLLRQSSIASISESTRGCFHGLGLQLPKPRRVYANLRRKVKQRFVLSTARFYTVNATYSRDGADVEDSYLPLESHRPAIAHASSVV